MVLTPVDCPFCEIVQREAPDAREVYRDEHVIAFFPTEPAVLGHTLIVPREHVSDIWSVSEETAAHLATATVRLALAIRAAVHSEGLNVIQSNGEAATQTVFHLHLHLVPRWSDDAMGPIWPEETNYTETAKDEMQQRIRTAIREGCAR
ncbi:HIT family protein [Acidipropionibacterium timonense]|uniref:HIT family protein n=1 Tax=Acidipropionibacterium timonense TaxID=2161818 RepID=UPI001AEBED3A|nr:HIT family protein [Acidipropionibacterium timonense]